MYYLIGRDLDGDGDYEFIQDLENMILTEDANRALQVTERELDAIDMAYLNEAGFYALEADRFQVSILEQLFFRPLVRGFRPLVPPPPRPPRARRVPPPPPRPRARRVPPPPPAPRHRPAVRAAALAPRPGRPAGHGVARPRPAGPGAGRPARPTSGPGGRGPGGRGPGGRGFGGRGLGR